MLRCSHSYTVLENGAATVNSLTSPVTAQFRALQHETIRPQDQL